MSGIRKCGILLLSSIMAISFFIAIYGFNVAKAENLALSQSGILVNDDSVEVSGKSYLISNGYASMDLIENNPQTISFNCWLKTSDIDVRVLTVGADGEFYSLTAGGYVTDGVETELYACGKQSNGAFIYNSTENDEEIFADGKYHNYHVVIEKNKISFFKDSILAYVYGAHNSSDTSDFLTAFYENITNQEIYIGSPNNGSDIPYYIDSPTLMFDAIVYPSNIIDIMSKGEKTDYALNIINSVKVEASNSNAPVLQYSFNEDLSSGESVKNLGTKLDSSAKLSGDAVTENGVLSLDGSKAWLTLPETTWAGINDFTLSIDFQRDVSSRNDMLFYFSQRPGPDKLYNAASPSAKQSKMLQAFNAFLQPSGSTAEIATDIYDNTSNNNDFSGDSGYHKYFVYSDNGWHNFTVTYDKQHNQFMMYVDGLFYYKKVQDVDLSKWIYNFIGGVSYDATTDPVEAGLKTDEDAFFDRDFFKGKIDNVTLFNYVASDYQISSLAIKPVSIIMDKSSDDNSEKISNIIIFNGYSRDYAISENIGDVVVGKNTITDEASGCLLELVVLKRDPVDYSNTKCVSYIDENVLDKKLNIKYTDDSYEELDVVWNDSYEFSKNEVTYSGVVTDSAGRTADVSLKVTGTIESDDLSELIEIIDNVTNENFVDSTVIAFKEIIADEYNAAKSYVATEYEAVYSALADSYLLNKINLLDNSKIKFALKAYEDINGYADYSSVAQKDRYIAAYENLETLLSNANNLAQIENGIAELKESYTALNMTKENVGLYGTVVETSAGYSFTVPESSYNYTNYVGTNSLAGDFDISFVASNPEYTSNKLSWASVTFNTTKNDNAASIRFYQEFYTADLKPTSLLQASVSNYITESYEQQINDINIQLAVLKIELGSATGDEIDEIQNEIDKKIEQIIELANKMNNASFVGNGTATTISPENAVNVSISRRIEENDSVIYATISQVGMNDIEYHFALKDYVGAINVTFGGNGTGVKFRNVNVKGNVSEGETDGYSLIRGSAVIAENEISVESSSDNVKIIENGNDVLSFVAAYDLKFLQINDNSSFELRFDDKSGLCKERMIIDFENNSLVLNLYGKSATINTDMLSPLTENTQYRFIVSREVGTASAYSFLLMKDDLKILSIKAQSSYCVEKLKSSFISSNLSYTISNSQKRDMSDIYSKVAYNKNDWSSNSLKLFTEELKLYDYSPETIAKMTNSEFESLKTDLAAVRNLLVPSIYKNYDEIANITIDAGADVALYLQPNVKIYYTSGQSSNVKITWNTKGFDNTKIGEQVISGTIVDRDSAEHSVSVKVIVKATNNAQSGCNGTLNDSTSETVIFVVSILALAITLIAKNKKRIENK